MQMLRSVRQASFLLIRTSPPVYTPWQPESEFPVTKRKTSKTGDGSPKLPAERKSTVSALVAKMAGTEDLVSAMPFNENKAGEHGEDAATPEPGAVREPSEPG